jgi:hypothetical protein
MLAILLIGEVLVIAKHFMATRPVRQGISTAAKAERARSSSRP